MSERTLVVREASEEDLSAVLRIERESFADPWSAESFETSLALDRMHFLVADGAGKGAGGGPDVQGYVIALEVLDEAEIVDIAVAAEARCRGVGGQLLDAAVADLTGHGVRAVYLEVREGNVAARALYLSRHFREVGRRRGYYQQPPEDALVLKREIGTA